MKTATESLKLPSAVAAYFNADRNGGDVSQCFTEDAVVTDESHAYEGRAAIKDWKTAAAIKYQYTTEPYACEEANGKIVVTSHVAGNFPGSPIDVRYFFTMGDGKIASLEIVA